MPHGGHWLCCCSAVCRSINTCVTASAVKMPGCRHSARHLLPARRPEGVSFLQDVGAVNVHTCVLSYKIGISRVEAFEGSVTVDDQQSGHLRHEVNKECPKHVDWYQLHCMCIISLLLLVATELQGNLSAKAVHRRRSPICTRVAYTSSAGPDAAGSPPDAVLAEWLAWAAANACAHNQMHCPQLGLMHHHVLMERCHSKSHGVTHTACMRGLSYIHKPSVDWKCGT